MQWRVPWEFGAAYPMVIEEQDFCFTWTCVGAGIAVG